MSNFESITVTAGFVCVPVPVKDGEGTQRTIDFRRVGKRLYGGALYHRSCAQYLAPARQAALYYLTKFKETL